MSYGLTDIELRKLIGAITESPEVEEIILYGSRARGNYRRYSDIDLTLTGESLERRTLYRILERIADLLLPYEIDLSIKSELDYQPLLDEINTEGITIYKRS